MNKIIVTEIIDAYTIRVNQWHMNGPNGYRGEIVKIIGYPDLGYSHKITIAKLEILLMKRVIKLTNAKKILKDGDQYIVHCSVYLNGVNIKEYFPELTEIKKRKL